MGLPLGPDAWRGWHQASFPTASWRIEGDELVAIAGAPCVDLVSHARYRDFRLRFEVALPEAGNSGVLYRVDERAELAWHSGPEMQLLDDARHADGRAPLTANGALYALVAPTPATAIQPGASLRGEVLVRGSKIEHWLNGRQVMAADLDDPALLARIASSKFAAWPAFARATEGHVVLQHHGDAVRFRAITVEPFV